MKIIAIILLAMGGVLGFARTVHVTDFGPTETDATAAFQAALDSNADVVIVDNPGYTYWVNPLYLRSNQELVFKDGVVVQAMKGGFKGTNDSLFKGVDVENVIMRGEGTAVLQMNKRDYWDKSAYKPAEWRHAIALLSTRNVRISNLTIRSSGGDGIYVSTSNESRRQYCKDTLIEDCLLDDHHRQGISVIGAENLLIRNCVLQNTQGTAPQCGIDFEPNHAEKEALLNCVVERCRFVKNAFAGILIHCPGQRIPIDITFKDCVISDNRHGIVCSLDFNEESPSKGLVKFQNVTVEDNAASILIRNTRPEGPVVLFQNGVVKAMGDTGTVMDFSTTFPQDFGNVIFDDLRVVKSAKQTLLTLNNPRGSGLVLPPGQITVEDAASHEQTIVPTEELNALYPRNEAMANFAVMPLKTQGLKPATDQADGKSSFALRSSFIPYYQYVKADTELVMDFRVLFLADTDNPVDCKVIDTQNETQIAEFRFTEPTFTWRYIPPTTTVLRLEFNTHRKSILIESHHPGFGFGAYPAFKAFRSTGELYFVVPKELEEVVVKVQGDDNEAVQIEIVDGQGQVRATSEYTAAAQLLTIPREATAAPEWWRVRVVKMVEDYSIQLAAPIPPILYSSLLNVLE